VLRRLRDPRQLASAFDTIRSGDNFEEGLCVGHWDLFDVTDDPGITDKAI
jgi:hypothetical protein